MEFYQLQYTCKNCGYVFVRQYNYGEQAGHGVACHYCGVRGKCTFERLDISTIETPYQSYDRKRLIKDLNKDS